MDDEEEEYDFEYSDEEQDEADIDVENTYYSAKGVKQTDPQAALQEFAKVRRKKKRGTTTTTIIPPPIVNHLLCMHLVPSLSPTDLLLLLLGDQYGV